jgi:hypothetical protein
MHWEKIPWSIVGRELWRTQVEEANKQDARQGFSEILSVMIPLLL